MIVIAVLLVVLSYFSLTKGYEVFGIKISSIKQIEENIPNAILNGDRENRLAGNANFSFKGIDAGQLLLKLDESGICASAGSACSTGEALPSHVLTAIGLDSNLAKSALRVSFGRENTLEDVDFLVNKIKEFIKK